MENSIKGMWFQAEKPSFQWHLLTFEVRKPEYNVFVTIYRVNELPGEANFTTGQEVELAEHELEDFATVDLWNKYYFPVFTSEQNQWYYDTAEPEATAQVLNYAIKKGLEIGNIETF